MEKESMVLNGRKIDHLKTSSMTFTVLIHYTKDRFGSFFKGYFKIELYLDRI